MLNFAGIPSLPVSDCLALMCENPEILLLDVRRFDEHSEAAIPGSTHLEEKGLILYCRSGVRSLQAARFLRDQGFERLWNMEGGILAYQAEE